jgi:hypothetical protein
MSTQKFDGNTPSRRKQWAYALVGITLGVGLLCFSPPELLRGALGFGLGPGAILGYGASLLWFLLALALVVSGITNLLPALTLPRDESHKTSEETRRRDADYGKTAHADDIGKKLRKLRHLKDHELITAEEHERKLADLLAKW